MKLIEYLQQFDLFEPLLIFIISIAPITELRLSIPYGILFTELDILPIGRRSPLIICCTLSLDNSAGKPPI